MTITACPHGMGLPAACIDCLADGPCPTSNGTTTVPGWPWQEYVAHAGHCPGCHTRIEADEVGPAGRRWFCTECAS